MDMRMRLRVAAAAADVAALATASVLAVWLRSILHNFMSVSPLRAEPHWSLGLCAVVVLASFYLNGLHEREAFVSRPLHLWTLVRVSFGAFLVSAVMLYMVNSDRVGQSRFILVATFVLFVLLAGVLRIGLVGPLLVRLSGKWTTALIGDSREARVLAERLSDLRGFGRPEMLALSDALPDFLSREDHRAGEPPSRPDSPRAVFIDTLSMKPRDVFEIIRECKRRNVDVYVLSGLLGPLEGNRLLSALFRAPVTRVRKNLETASSHMFKRAFDIVGSAALLLLASPVIGVVAVLVKATSPGPVFYAQTRVGRFGVPFRFLKFRSMVVNNDSRHHEEYVTAFIAGEAETVCTPEGDVFKCVDDPRITRVGRFIRRYSLDEIPQFWNVLMGDMSLVGPRPPLSYEAEQYDEWATKRLLVPPGVTGIWQVEGRSRVSFDEMILQDLMYVKNMSLAVDVGLCLRTVPAVITGRGGG